MASQPIDDGVPLISCDPANQCLSGTYKLAKLRVRLLSARARARTAYPMVSGKAIRAPWKHATTNGTHLIVELMKLARAASAHFRFDSHPNSQLAFLESISSISKAREGTRPLQ